MAELKELKSVPHRDFYNVRKVRNLLLSPQIKNKQNMGFKEK